MSWVDSHAHLSMLDLDPAVALTRAHAADVPAVVCVGTDAASSAASIALAADHDEVRATVGLHPHDASRLDDEWADLVALAGADRVVAVGETGLDYHYLHSPAADQERAFRRQIGLAKARGLALVVHSRAAWDDTFRILEDEGPPDRTVLHCFTGGPDEARRRSTSARGCRSAGSSRSATPTTCRAAAALAPLGRLLVETDAPYLAPVPHRGEPNEPALVAVVGAAVAAARADDPRAVAEATAAGAATVFGPFAGR